MSLIKGRNIHDFSFNMGRFFLSYGVVFPVMAAGGRVSNINILAYKEVQGCLAITLEAP